MATGRIAGFSVQFLYGPLINENRLSYMLGLAGFFAIFGMASSYQTTDTTHVDLQDHWECGKTAALTGSSNESDGRKSYSAVQ